MRRVRRATGFLRWRATDRQKMSQSTMDASELRKDHQSHPQLSACLIERFGSCCALP